MSRGVAIRTRMSELKSPDWFYRAKCQSLDSIMPLPWLIQIQIQIQVYLTCSQKVKNQEAKQTIEHCTSKQ